MNAIAPPVRTNTSKPKPATRPVSRPPVREFVPQQPIYLEKFDDCPGLGRIAVMDSNNLVMLGKVISVKYKPYKKK